jgi:hypothetical protein
MEAAPSSETPQQFYYRTWRSNHLSFIRKTVGSGLHWLILQPRSIYNEVAWVAKVARFVSDKIASGNLCLT